MHKELVFSFLVFTLSLIGSSFSYYTIIRQETVSNTVSDAILNGRHKYLVKESGNCIGEMDYELVQKNNISEIKSSGTIRLKYQNSEFPVNFLLESSFNSIGQLGGALLRVDIQESYILIGAINIDPIKITIKSNLLQGEREFVFNISGPIELKSSQNNTFKITGLSLNKYDSKLLEFPVEITETNESQCADSNKYFDITQQLERLKTVYSGYIKL